MHSCGLWGESSRVGTRVLATAQRSPSAPPASQPDQWCHSAGIGSMRVHAMHLKGDSTPVTGREKGTTSIIRFCPLSRAACNASANTSRNRKIRGRISATGPIGPPGAHMSSAHRASHPTKSRIPPEALGFCADCTCRDTRARVSVVHATAPWLWGESGGGIRKDGAGD